MKLVRFFAIATLLSLLSACSTVQRPTTLATSFWQQPGKKIAVSVQPLPKPASHKMGVQGLLDVAINDAVASGWDAHVESMVFEPYQELAGDLAASLKAKGFLTEVMGVDVSKLKVYEPGEAQKSTPTFEYDLTKLGKLGREYFLLVRINAVGTARDYYGFVPLSAPRGYVAGNVALVDVRTNELLWWKDLLINKGVNGPWDQPPAYPNLSQAIDQAIEQSRQDIIAGLYSSLPTSGPTASR